LKERKGKQNKQERTTRAQTNMDPPSLSPIER